MPDPDLIGLFIAPLEGAGVSYMVTGGVASVIYGDPRFTRDVDVVLELSRGEIPALVSAFDSAAFYVPPVFRQSGSDRHLRDVAMMFRISGDTVDAEALLAWCHRLDLTATLERARRYPTD